MINENDLDEMFLPGANSNEELETLSEHKLEPLFQPSCFELCTRDKRDKGIDLTYEIKRNNKQIGFRFIIQLKSTKSIKPNKSDGSFSKSIKTSNINFLLNNGHPAFYVLYVVRTDTFYYEKLSDFIMYLNNKNKNWDKQANHILHFKRKLLPDGINTIYDIAMNKGLFQRNLFERASFISRSVNTTDRISIDSDFNITDDGKIRELIENLGFELINEGKWREILSVHHNATGNVATTALYNLILGIANYYGGSRFEAISFFKKSRNLKSELDDEMKMQLEYFDITVRYSCDLISEEEYNKRILKLENSETVGLYIKLDNAKHNYFKSMDNNSGERFDLYVKEIEEIINHPKANEGLILTAKCELILFQGFNNNHDFVKGIAHINAMEEIFGIDIPTRIQTAKEFMDINTSWYKDVRSVIDEARKYKNKFAYYSAVTNEVKVSYQFMVYMSMVTIQKEIPGHTKIQKPDNSQLFELKLSNISEAANFFNHIGHIENTIAAFSTMYELLHYLNRIDDANNVMDELCTLVDKFDLQDHRRKLDLLKNEGTTHELFKTWLEQIFANSEKIKKEFDELKADMIRMDHEESQIINKQIKGNYQIELFPIGYFQFPQTEKDNVYNILHVDNPETKNIFDEMFKIVIPIANIHYNPIEIEGHINGNLADRGIESWRNIYRIRKAFYVNKYYRFEINFGKK